MIIPYWKEPDSHRITTFLSAGGYERARKALTKMKPEEVLDEVKEANLRGRGGAGFPAGLKWSFIPGNTGKPTYLIVNADEGEPGTFKDKYIMLHSPHLLIEGILIACYAIRAHVAYIYIRGEYEHCRRRLQKAIEEAYSMGFLGKNIMGTGFYLDIYIHRGAGAYIAGEETGLLEALEGKRAYPRIKPPFPATVGAFGCPTAINNVETLAYIPFVIEMGGEQFAEIGLGRSGGLKLYCISGHVEKPGVYEAPFTTTIRELIENYGGGVWKNRQLKGVIPGGLSAPVLTPDEIDIPAEFDALMKAGSMLGSAGIIVLDEQTCMVHVLKVLTDFYADESCGQCTPCREGTHWIYKIVEDLMGDDARIELLDTLENVALSITGKTVCAFGDAASLPIPALLKKYREEFVYHIEHHRCDVLEKYGEISNPLFETP